MPRKKIDMGLNNPLYEQMQFIRSLENNINKFGGVQNYTKASLAPLADALAVAEKLKFNSGHLSNLIKLNETIQQANTYGRFGPNLDALTLLFETKIPDAFRAVESFKKSVQYNKYFNTIYDLAIGIPDRVFYEKEFDLLPNFEEKPEDEKSSIILVTNKIESLIQDVYASPDLIYSVHPRDFEKMVGEMLSKAGFEVELTQTTRDGGKDIIAMKYDSMFGPQKYLVECKRKEKGNIVGVDVLRSFMYVVNDEKATQGMIVTSSYFSSDLKKERDKQPHLLSLTDNTDLMRWIYNYLYKI